MRSGSSKQTMAAMTDLEPYAPHRRPEPDTSHVRLRFIAAIVLTVIVMVAVIALIVWLPIVD